MLTDAVVALLLAAFLVGFVLGGTLGVAALRRQQLLIQARQRAREVRVIIRPDTERLDFALARWQEALLTRSLFPGRVVIL